MRTEPEPLQDESAGHVIARFHEGEARIGDDAVSRERAHEMVITANDTIDWIEALLPEDTHRPPVHVATQIESTVPLTHPEAAEVPAEQVEEEP